MRRVSIVFVVLLAGGVLAVAGIAGTGEPAGDPAPVTFRLADGSAGCRLVTSRELACRTSGIEAAVVLANDGSSYVSHVDVAWNQRTRVLRAGQVWWHAGFLCRVDRNRVHCTAGDGSVAAGRTRIGGVL